MSAFLEYNIFTDNPLMAIAWVTLNFFSYHLMWRHNSNQEESATKGII